VAATIPLPESEIHIWMVAQDAIADAAVLERYDFLMTLDEREIQRRFLRARDRHEYLVTRALVRTVLSRYVDVPPETWRFYRNEFGRPYVDWKTMGVTPSLPGLLFNLSNTAGLVVCGVSSKHELGVDVEPLARHDQILGIANTVFAGPELEILPRLPTAERRRAAVDFWTLKEAYIKARGMGLSIPLEQFWYTLGDPIRIAFDVRLGDDPANWQFGQVEPNGEHLISWAVCRGRAPNVTVLAKAFAPLMTESDWLCLYVQPHHLIRDN